MFNIKNYFFELKQRCLFLTITWCFLLINSYINKEMLIYIFFKPIIIFQKTKSLYFIFTDVTEIFLTYVDIILFISNNCLLLFGYYHIINFILPGLYNYEAKELKNIFSGLIFWWCICFFFWYKFFIPATWNFFFNFQESSSYKIINTFFYFEFKMSEYIKFFIKLYFLHILTSHFFSFLVNFFNKLKKKTFFFIRYQRKKFFIILILGSTIFSTPDTVNQIVLSLYFIIIYEIIIVYIICKNKNLIYY